MGEKERNRRAAQSAAQLWINEAPARAAAEAAAADAAAACAEVAPAAAYARAAAQDQVFDFVTGRSFPRDEEMARVWRRFRVAAGPGIAKIPEASPCTREEALRLLST